MKGSAGVLVIAILSLIGSTLTLLLGIGTGLLMFMMPTPKELQGQAAVSPDFFKIMAIFTGLMYILPAIWGIVTGIGLLRLKNWARISTIVFSVLLICLSGFSMLAMVFILPAIPSNNMDHQAMTIVSVFVALFWTAHIAVGVWWLVFLTRPKVKTQFVKLTPDVSATQAPLEGTAAVPPGITVQQQLVAERRRPLSISIIGWWMLITCLFVPLNIFMGSPAALFTKVLTGWPATLFFVVVFGLHAYVGWGLLRLNPVARLVTIAWLTFGVINSGIFYFAPGREARISGLIHRSMALFPWGNPEMSLFRVDLMPLMYIGMVFGLLLVTIPLYFLVTRKAAFQPNA